jgi:hypothetical protein
MTATANLFGTTGLTIGSLGIWGVFGGLAIWWIRGMADRRRAVNEGLAVGGQVAAALFDQMRAEIARMGEKIEKLEQRVGVLEEENRGLIRERDVADTKVARLEAVIAGQGEINNRVAQFVAADRLKAAGVPVAVDGANS